MAVTPERRLFVSFPAWGINFSFSLGEVIQGDVCPFAPLDGETGEKLDFINVQSIKAGKDGILWILDNANPDFKGYAFPDPVSLP